MHKIVVTKQTFHDYRFPILTSLSSFTLEKLNSNANLKVKTTEGIGVHSLTCNIFEVRGVC
jgi:hypothetical protein